MQFTSISCPFISRKRGFTLVEGAIVMLLLGALLGTVFIYTSKANQEAQEKKLLSQITTMASNLKDFLSRQDTVPSMETMMQLGVVPAEMVQNNNIIRHAAGGTVTVQIPNSSSFSLTLTNILASQCQALFESVVSNAANPEDLDLLSARIHNQTISIRGSATADASSRLIAACNTISATANITLTYSVGS